MRNLSAVVLLLFTLPAWADEPIAPVPQCFRSEPIGTRFVWRPSEFKGIQVLYRNDRVYGCWYADRDLFRYTRPILGGWGPLRVPPWKDNVIPTPRPEARP